MRRPVLFYGALGAAGLALILGGVWLARARSPAAPSPAPVVITSSDAMRVLAGAQDDYTHGNYSSAIRAARAVLDRPDLESAHHARARRILGTASCFLKDRDGAREAWNGLESSGRQLIHYVCQRNGIDVTDGLSTGPQD